MKTVTLPSDYLAFVKHPTPKSEVYRCEFEGNGHILRISKISRFPPMNSDEYLYMDLAEARMLRDALIAMDLSSPST